VKIGLTDECGGQRRDAGLAVASQSQVAQDGVELAEVAGVEIDRERGGTGHGVRAEISVGFQLAGGKIELQPAQIDGAVALHIGGVDQTACGHFAASRVSRRSETQQGVDGEGTVVAVDPQCVGRTVHERIEAEMLEGRVGNHLQQRVQGNILELRRYLAVDGDGDAVGGFGRLGGENGLGA
jgi:hypothetical protein